MSEHKYRFSRRFLNILIFVTAIAILILSQTGKKEESEPSQQPAETQQSGQ